MNLQYLPDRLLDTTDAKAAAEWDRLLTEQVALFADREIQTLRDIEVLGAARRVLDVGCGNGAFLARLHEQFPEKDCIGIDVSAELVDIATGRHARAGLRFEQGDFLGSVLLPGCDLIILRFVVQYLACVTTILQRAAQALAQGGVVLVIEPDLGRSVASPPMPAFTAMLSAFEIRQELAGRLRTRLGEITKEAKDTGLWEPLFDDLVAIPIAAPIQRDKAVTVFARWIALCERAAGFDYPFEQARRDLEAWARDPIASAGIALKVVALRYRPDARRKTPQAPPARP